MQALVKLEKNQVVKNLAAELKKQMDNTPLAKKNPQTPLANSATTTRKPTLTLKWSHVNFLTQACFMSYNAHIVVNFNSENTLWIIVVL